jgi:hypothetical protein
VSGAGDVNGDGKADALVGASGALVDGVPWSGAAYLVSGPLSGTIDLSAAHATFLGARGEEAGYAVSGAGDMDGDGTADVVIGAPGYGVTYLVLGPVSGTIDLELADGFLVGEGPYDLAGNSVSDAGDVDADGHDDLLIGARDNASSLIDQGAAYLVLGPVTGTVDLAAADAKISGETWDDMPGYCVSGAGDVDADGHDDWLIGAGAMFERPSSGAACTVLGPIPRDIISPRADAKMMESTRQRCGASRRGCRGRGWRRP